MKLKWNNYSNLDITLPKQDITLQVGALENSLSASHMKGTMEDDKSSAGREISKINTRDLRRLSWASWQRNLASSLRKTLPCLDKKRGVEITTKTWCASRMHRISTQQQSRLKCRQPERLTERQRSTDHDTPSTTRLEENLFMSTTTAIWRRRTWVRSVEESTHTTRTTLSSHKSSTSIPRVWDRSRTTGRTHQFYLIWRTISTCSPNARASTRLRQSHSLTRQRWHHSSHAFHSTHRLTSRAFLLTSHQETTWTWSA